MPAAQRDLQHSFVIPAYGASGHLAPLVESLLAQTDSGSQIILTTSTPNDSLDRLAGHYQLPLIVNPKRVDIATDWNFALDAVTTPLVTLAHQDDYYDPHYLIEFKAAIARHPDALFAFCDYREHTPSGPRPLNINLRIKSALCRRAFGSREAISTRRDKMRLLSLGNPVCCPSVMFNRARARGFQFPSGFKTNLDWQAWLGLARADGAFVYLGKRLVSKGVHDQSETTATIANRARAIEDRLLLNEFWPGPVATVLSQVYKLGYLANRVRPGRD